MTFKEMWSKQPPLECKDDLLKDNIHLLKWCYEKGQQDKMDEMSYLMESKIKLKDQLESYEGYINDIPLVIDPCKMCKIYKDHNGYDIGDRLVNGVWQKGYCDDCCWCYSSKFEVEK